jgi:GAF domain-containing protein
VSPVPSDLVLMSITRAAVDATGATLGWLVALDGDGLRVVAAAGADVPVDLVDTRVAAGGAAALVLASGQPMAVVPRSNDEQFSRGVPAAIGVTPTSVLCVPCGEDQVMGALEVINKAGGGSFSFDDVEIATLLAGIAGAALSSDARARTVPSPRELANDLEVLAAQDPSRYATIAGVLGALFDRE